MPKSLLSAVRQYVKSHGGECLTTLSEHPVEIRLVCSNGHAWNANPNRLLDGNWCPRCARNELYLKAIRQIAKDRGGQCLENEYVNSTTKMRFQCEKGHTWETNSHTLKKGAWCRHCHHESMKNTLEDMHRLAKKRGGKCLAKEYVRNNYPIKWQCELGHKFMAQPANVTVGEWCPNCARDKQRLTIEDVQQTARERGGRLISKKYTSSHEKLKFECEEGHQWFASVNNVRHGAWCPVCAGNRPKTLLDMHRFAKKLGGKCLAYEYKNQKEKLSWVCSEGHQFTLPATKVFHRGQWCPQCSGKRIYAIDDVKQVAAEKGGSLISRHYQNNHTPLIWQCGDCSLKFKRTLKEVLQKERWCPICRVNKKRNAS